MGVTTTVSADVHAQPASPHSWSLPSHMYEVSAWSADCARPGNPMSCVSAGMPKNRTASNPTPSAWTDLTWLLHKKHVSWGYYLDHGVRSRANPPGCYGSGMCCPASPTCTLTGR